jgi:hypothetical protein
MPRALLLVLLLSPLVFSEAIDLELDSYNSDSLLTTADAPSGAPTGAGRPTPNFWTSTTGIVSMAVLGSVLLLTFVVLLVYFRRKREQMSEESGTWRDPLRYSIEADLIQS